MRRTLILPENNNPKLRNQHVYTQTILEFGI